MGHFLITRFLLAILILVILIGRNAGLKKDLKYRICYETHFSSFCTDLKQQTYASQNMTAHKSTGSSADFDPNLILHVQNVTELDLSMNTISRLKFYDSGAIELEINLACPSLLLNNRFQETFFHQKPTKQNLRCKYYQYKVPGEMKNNTDGSNQAENIQHLILSHNMLTSLVNIFNNLSNLQFLDVSFNRIDHLTNETFRNNAKLISLKLDNNRIKSLRKQTFECLKNLQHLDLSKNQIKRFGLDIFEYLNNLLVLQINNNFNFTGDSDSLSLIFSTGQKFEKLEMTGTLLSKIPIILTRSIRELDLSNNNLVSIHCGEMDSYPLLQRLSLKNNKLSNIEEDSLGRLEYLSELNVHKNKLNRIPLSLPSGLIYLDLGYNRIETVNRTDFNGLIHLKKLVLKSNQIVSLEDGSFHQLLKLESLDISNNPIKLLTSNIFVGPNSLIHLQLSNLSRLDCEGIPNCMKMFPFTELAKLEVLNLESSPLLSKQMIYDQSVLPTLSHLKELNLANTNLTELNSELVNHLRRLRKLELHQNPFNCSKSALWLKKWLVSLDENNSQDETLEPRNETASISDTPRYTSVKIILKRSGNALSFLQRENGTHQSPRCAFPPSLAGKPILDLTEVEEPRQETAIPKPMVNSILLHKDSNYDDVFYQNDSPESSFVSTTRAKGETATPVSEMLTQKDSAQTPATQTGSGNTDATKNVEKVETLINNGGGGISKRNTTVEPDNPKTVKHEIKNILNKSHIQINRSILKTKNLNNTMRAEKESQKEKNYSSADARTHDKPLSESAQSKYNKQILNNITELLPTENGTIDESSQSKNTLRNEPLKTQNTTNDRLSKPINSSARFEIHALINETSSTTQQTNARENETSVVITSVSTTEQDLNTKRHRTTIPSSTKKLTASPPQKDIYLTTTTPASTRHTLIWKQDWNSTNSHNDFESAHLEKNNAKHRNQNDNRSLHKNESDYQLVTKKETGSKIKNEHKFHENDTQLVGNEESAKANQTTTQMTITSKTDPRHNFRFTTIKSTKIDDGNLTSVNANSLNKYNVNIEGIGGVKDDAEEKPGSHPGMLIFLLVLSVLLFSLSLMLISHWTWCRQLSIVYELGEQQILEESDYEINSLTNFKDHEHW